MWNGSIARALCQKLDIAFVERDFQVYDVMNPDEALLSSTAYGLAPVTRIKAAPIGEGTLTNRLRLLDKPHLFAGSFGYGKIVKFKPEEWVEKFAGSQPVQITFDFTRPCPLDRVRVFFHGELSGVEAETSVDGQAWKPAGLQAGRHTGFEEVALLHVPLATASPARYLRLTFKREGRDQVALALCEMEVWSR